MASEPPDVEFEGIEVNVESIDADSKQLKGKGDSGES